jgi:hypothetical protein
MKYRPTSKQERHQKYLGAFSAFCVEDEYLSNITNFIMDPKNSPSNDDDVELFKDLLFESKFGMMHICYFDLMFSRLCDKPNFDWTIRVIAKYIEFIHKISKFYSDDIFDTFLTELNTSHDAIGLLLRHLPMEERMYLVKVARAYPMALSRVPKLKLYALFS